MRLSRLLPLAALAVAALLSTAGTASAADRCGGGHGRQGGPVRSVIGGVIDRVQERRAARGCQPTATAFPAAPAVAGVPAVVSGDVHATATRAELVYYHALSELLAADPHSPHIPAAYRLAPTTGPACGGACPAVRVR